MSDNTMSGFNFPSSRNRKNHSTFSSMKVPGPSGISMSGDDTHGNDSSVSYPGSHARLGPRSMRHAAKPSNTHGGGGHGVGYSGDSAHGNDSSVSFPGKHAKLGPKKSGSRAVSSSQRGGGQKKGPKVSGNTRTDKGQGFNSGQGFNRTSNSGAGRGRGMGGGKGKNSKFGGH